ncbi:MAG: glycosyltransferase family 39 protein [Alphaproteobacteria bacterium]
MVRPAAGPWLLFLSAAGLAIRLRWAGPADVADLFPPPDAVQYETAAANLVAGRGYVLDRDGAIYPPRYPPGFPLLMALGSPLTGTRVGFGIRTVQALSAASILIAALLAWRAAGPWAGAAAATILAVSFAHVQYSWIVFADVPSAGACALVGAWALAALRRKSSRVEALAIGLAAGALALVRTSNVIFLPPLLVVCLVDRRRRRDLPWLACLCAAMASGAALVLLDHGWRFGSPFEAGYSFWLGDGFRPFSLSTRNYFGRSRFPVPDGPPNLPHYLAVLVGAGELWPWPVGVLLVAGMVVSARSRDDDARRLATFTGAFFVATLAFFGAYYWQDKRFLLPLSSFAAAVAGIPVGLTSPRWARPAGLALLAIAVVVSLEPYGKGLWAGRIHERSRVAGMLAAVDRVAPRDAVVLAPGDPFVADRLLRMPAHDRPAASTSDRRFVGLGRNWFEQDSRPRRGGEIQPQRRLPSRGWMLGLLPEPADRAATAARIAEGLDGGRAVVLAEPVDARPWTGWKGGRPAPEFARFDFRVVARPPGFVVYQVSRGRGGGGGSPSAAGPP